MQTAIIISQKDIAGLNIKNSLLNYFRKNNEKFEDSEVYELDNLKMYTTNKDSIHCENIDKKFIRLYVRTFNYNH